MVIGQVDPAHAAVGDDTEDFVLLRDHIARFQLRRRNFLALDLLCGIDKGGGGIGRGDKRQAYHAISNRPLGALRAAALAEGIDRLPARTLRGLFLRRFFIAFALALGADIL